MMRSVLGRFNQIYILLWHCKSNLDKFLASLV